jgi:tRNA threonylcarbamoyladenosine biosynthesis protein TsaE
MREKLIREWKKVFESDLGYISYELKELVTEPAMVILDGPMGAGKTTFAKSFVHDGETLSPSYSILSESEMVLHADLYRIEDRGEIIHLELSLYLDNKKYFLVEWGRAHFNSLLKELPESYKTYLLKIEVNENAQQETSEKSAFSRNFSLYEIAED